MSLWFGQNDGGEVADLIATVVNESQILQILDEYVEPEIGTIRLAVNAAATLDLSLIPFSSSITTATQASLFKNGWAYTNGAWISRTFFPKAFEVLNAAGLPTSGSNVQLPNLGGFLYAASTASSNSGGIFKQDPQSYGLPKHNHDFKFESSVTTRTLVRNAAWIYSTKSAGTGTASMPAKTYTSGGKTYNIPAGTPTAHSGHKNQNRKRLIVWDIPVNVSSSSSGRIDTTTGWAEATTSNTEICPRHVIVNSLIFIGRPQNV